MDEHINICTDPPVPICQTLLAPWRSDGPGGGGAKLKAWVTSKGPRVAEGTLGKHIWTSEHMEPGITTVGLQPTCISDLLQPYSDGLQPNSYGLQPTGDGLQPNSNGLQPNSKGLQPSSDGLQPNSDGLHLIAKATNLIAMAST